MKDNKEQEPSAKTRPAFGCSDRSLVLYSTNGLVHVAQPIRTWRAVHIHFLRVDSPQTLP